MEISRFPKHAFTRGKYKINIWKSGKKIKVAVVRIVRSNALKDEMIKQRNR